MKIAVRLLVALVLASLLALAGYGVGWSNLGVPWSHDDSASTATTAEPRGARPAKPAKPIEPAKPVEPVEPVDSPDPTVEPTDEPTAEPTEPALVAGPALLAPDDENPQVRELQARLRQIDWFEQDVTGYYGEVTTQAVSGFQAKRGFPVTGEVDERTWQRLLEMTTDPTDAELANQLGENVPGVLDPRCLSGHVLCVDKSSRTLRWVVDGEVQRTFDVRFGAEYTPTREGAFSVEYKSRDHVSSLYGSAMPYAMFFSGGQAVHYSSDFDTVGYAGASHGCVNVRDYDGIAWLFDQVEVGDAVIVYWS